jgi:hypothetical protein
VENPFVTVQHFAACEFQIVWEQSHVPAWKRAACDNDESNEISWKGMEIRTVNSPKSRIRGNIQEKFPSSKGGFCCMPGSWEIGSDGALVSVTQSGGRLSMEDMGNKIKRRYSWKGCSLPGQGKAWDEKRRISPLRPKRGSQQFPNPSRTLLSPPTAERSVIDCTMEFGRLILEAVQAQTFRVLNVTLIQFVP